MNDEYDKSQFDVTAFDIIFCYCRAISKYFRKIVYGLYVEMQFFLPYGQFTSVEMQKGNF